LTLHRVGFEFNSSLDEDISISKPGINKTKHWREARARDGFGNEIQSPIPIQFHLIRLIK